MTDIERRNATYDAYVKIERWIKKYAAGIWDERQEFTVTTSNTGACGWELNINPDGSSYLMLNRTNHSSYKEVTSAGLTDTARDNHRRVWRWNRDKGMWDCGEHVPSTDYPKDLFAVDGMFGAVTRWKDIKHWIELRKQKCDALMNFEL